MTLTRREEQLWQELHDWRHSFYEYEATDVENSLDKWLDQAFQLLPETLQFQFFEKLDSWLFHLNSLLRSTKLQNEAAERILNAARTMNDEINSITDIQHLPIDQSSFLAEQQAAKHRIYSLLQGGLVGTGQSLAITSDFIAMLVINLRAVQLTAMSFGHEVQSPAELIETLKVYNAATMPKRLQMFGWEDLMDDLQKEERQFYMDRQEQITDQSWLDEPLKQLLKTVLIFLFSKQKLSNIPIVSVAIGSGVNYQTTRKVTHFALKYYQYKHLYKKNGMQL